MKSNSQKSHPLFSYCRHITYVCMCGSLVFIASYFLEMSAYILFLSSITFGLNSTQSMGWMDAVLCMFFATVSVSKFLYYPLDITKSHKLWTLNLCLVQPIPPIVSFKSVYVFSVTPAHHQFYYRSIPS